MATRIANITRSKRRSAARRAYQRLQVRKAGQPKTWSVVGSLLEGAGTILSSGTYQVVRRPRVAGYIGPEADRVNIAEDFATFGKALKAARLMLLRVK